MGRAERLMVAALIRRVEAGADAVSAEELREAARAAGVDRGAALERGVERLVRRGLLSSQWEAGQVVGYRPTEKAYAELQSGSEA
jgi:hypothetical protein